MIKTLLVLGVFSLPALSQAQANETQFRQIALTAQLALVSMKDETQVYERPLIVKRYTSTGKVLDPASAEYCVEAAATIRRTLDAYLSAR